MLGSELFSNNLFNNGNSGVSESVNNLFNYGLLDSSGGVNLFSSLSGLVAIARSHACYESNGGKIE